MCLTTEKVKIHEESFGLSSVLGQVTAVSRTVIKTSCSDKRLGQPELLLQKKSLSDTIILYKLKLKYL